MSLKTNLKKLRKAAGLSKIGLATAAGLSTAHVRHIESGYIKHPSASTLSRLAATLGVTIDNLLSEEVSTTKKKVAAG